MFARRLLVSFAALAMAGCATVGNGPMQRITVDSNPQGARVRLYNCGTMATKSATTPAVVWVSRRSTQCRLRVSLPGQEERVTRAWRRLQQLPGSGLPILDYPLPEVRLAKHE